MLLAGPIKKMLNRLSLLTFVAMTAGSVLIGWRTLAGAFSLAWNNEAYTHILLILPISAALIYMERPFAHGRPASDLRSGAILLSAAMMMAGVARWSSGMPVDVKLSLQMLALVFWWIGAFVSCFGRTVLRAALFPLCFLLWLVPLPAFLLNAIVRLLQQGSAYAAQFLFMGVGIPVVQDGIVLTIPGLTVEVAQECSSIRSSMILLVTTMVLAQVFLRSPWRKALVIALAVPLSVAKNGLRIFTIAMLGTRVDPGFLTGRLHRHGGVVFLAIALAAIFFLLWILHEREGPHPEVEFASR